MRKKTKTECILFDSIIRVKELAVKFRIILVDAGQKALTFLGVSIS